jgi:DNA invertase Pin-like site-specific DNA recombinase
VSRAATTIQGSRSAIRYAINQGKLVQDKYLLSWTPNIDPTVAKGPNAFGIRRVVYVLNNITNETTEFSSTSAVAEALNMSRNTVPRLIQNGRIFKTCICFLLTLLNSQSELYTSHVPILTVLLV